MNTNLRILSLRRVARVMNGGTPGKSDHFWNGKIPWATPVDLGKVSGGFLSKTGRFITEAGLIDGSARAPGNSVLLSCRAPIGYVAINEVPMAFNQGCKAIIPRDKSTEARFLKYALESSADALRAAGQGSTFLEVSSNQVSDLKIPWASVPVQRRIADYLDHETAEIDALIEDLTLLSITVREFFEASLNQQTNQPWQTGASDDKVIPLTRALPERVDYRGATPLKTVSGTQLVTARNVRQGWIDYKTNQEFVDTNEYYSIMSRGIPKLGDILFTMEAPLGNVALVDRTDIALAQRIIKFSAADFVQPKFILYAIMSQSFQSQLLTLASGSTALGLKASKLNQLKVRVPSIGSQRKIVEEIELLFNRSVGVRRDIERAVEVARERRAALITAAVTGQIDVTAKNKPAGEQLEDDIAQGLHKES